MYAPDRSLWIFHSGSFAPNLSLWLFRSGFFSPEQFCPSMPETRRAALSRHLLLWHTGDENVSESAPLQQLRNFSNRLFMLLFLILMKNRIKSSAVQIFLLSPPCCDQLCQILFCDAVIHSTAKPSGRKLCPKTALFKRLSKRRKSRHADHKIGTGKQRRLMLCRRLTRQST